MTRQLVAVLSRMQPTGNLEMPSAVSLHAPPSPEGWSQKLGADKEEEMMCALGPSH